MLKRTALIQVVSFAGSVIAAGSVYASPAKLLVPPDTVQEAGETVSATTTSEGDSNILLYLPSFIRTNSTSTADFTLTSSAVVNGELLAEYKCEEKVDGKEASIPLAWSGVPESAGSLAVIMHHYPTPDDISQVNSYLLLWGIDPSVTEIPYGEADDGSWYMGVNKDGVTVSYTSPCSPSPGSHEYTITLYALSATPPSLPAESSPEVNYDVLKSAIETVTVIATATLTFNDVNE